MSKRLNWVRLLSMALDAAKGMLYLHSRSPPIAHRDLKSANLLVDSQWHVKASPARDCVLLRCCWRCCRRCRVDRLSHSTLLLPRLTLPVPALPPRPCPPLPQVADFSLSRALEMGATAYTVVSTNPRRAEPAILDVPWGVPVWL